MDCGRGLCFVTTWGFSSFEGAGGGQLELDPREDVRPPCLVIAWASGRAQSGTSLLMTSRILGEDNRESESRKLYWTPVGSITAICSESGIMARAGGDMVEGNAEDWC